MSDRDQYDLSHSDTPNTRRKKRRRWPWFLLILLLLFLALPNLITMFGLERYAIDMATSDFKGKLSVGRSSVGWFQPITLKNVSAVDEAGQPLFSAAEVKTSKRLFSLINTNDYGHIELKQPVINLHLRPDGSNLEDALADYIPAVNSTQSTQPQQNHTAPTELPKVSISIVDGAATITSSTTPEAWSVDQLNMATEVKSETAPVASAIQCRVTSFLPDAGGTQIPQSSGNLNLSAQVDAGRENLAFNSINASVQTEQLPMSIVGPLVQRFLGPTRAAGNLDCEIVAACNVKNSSVAATVRSLNMSELQLSAPQLMGSDVFRLANASANGKINLSPALLSADNFKFNTDVGQLNADGSFDLNQINQLSTGTAMPATDFQMDGKLDLAALMKMLPNTFNTHQDLTLESGSATFHVGSQTQAGGRQLVLNLDTANLKANRAGQAIVWNEPIRLVGNVVQSDGTFALQRLQCISDFFTVNGSANFSEAVFDVQGDLSLLTDRLSDFIDLQSFALEGMLAGKFGWQLRDRSGTGATLESFATAQDRPMEVIGDFKITNPVIRMAGLADWKQPQIDVKMSANLVSLATGDCAVQQAGVRANLGTEQCAAYLAQPIANAFKNAVWSFNTQAVGDLGGLLRHVQNFVDLGPITAQGATDITCLTTLSGNLLDISNLKYDLRDVAFDGFALIIEEPQINGDAHLTYDLNTGVIDLKTATLSSSALSASGQNVQIMVADNIQINGDVRFRADVNRAADWIQMSPTDDSIFWFGDAQGTLRMASDAQGIGADVDMTIANLTAGQKTGGSTSGASGGNAFRTVSAATRMATLWSEKNVGVRGGVKLSNDFDSVGFQKMQLQANSITANINGTIAELSGPLVADLNGAWNPRWEMINSLLDVYTGRTVQLHGQGEQSLLVRGPLFPTTEQTAATGAFISPALQASTRVAWSQGSVLDIPVSGSQIDVIVDQGVAAVQTGTIEFAGGKIQMAPQIDLRSDQPVLYLDKKRILDNVKLTPETARTILKYLNPLAADATAAQGTFSIDSEGVKVPLMDPMQTEANVIVTLHDVVVGAGPMAQQLIASAKQLQTLLRPDKVNERDYNTWLKMSQQSVPVNVKNGRVYHDGIKFSHDDILVRTKGSVGLDQTVNMVAEIPIADDWLGGNEYLAGLKGQSISIPITGTVSKPVLDRSAIQNFSRQMAQKAASSAINKAVQDKLAPKLNEYQNQLNEKIGGEVSKLQNKFQSQIQDKLQEQVGNQIQGSLGDALKQQFGNAAQNRLGEVLKIPGAGTPAATGGDAATNVEEKLIRGIGNLFNGN
jgi:hypothetical protein